MKNQLKIVTTSIEQKAKELSGGNQQKVVFAKNLLTKPTVLLLDEPTVGIDVQVKGEIAKLIRSIANNGNAVLIVSSEMDEMARLCDRVLIIKDGQIIKEIVRKKNNDITERNLLEEIQ